RMQGMDMGPGTDLGGLGWFAGVWAVMMAAMMLPSLVPMAGAYAVGARRGAATVTPQSLTRTTLFTAGYLLVWMLAGIAAWVLVDVVRSLDPGFLRWDEGGRYVAAGVIAAAVLYELTSFKSSCLRHCRIGSFSSPIGGRDRVERSAWAWARGLTASPAPGR
ncbi:MAG TPA: DUF2182 domain-containing protein, partial [Solirubrobacterales bacterium]|nr:DUF2182 domain-containing protein [Solirubrobacterales bacterium]